MARNVVGIDLGTTNSALAHAALDGAGRSALQVDAVAQLVAPGEVLPRPTLPSFLYLAGAHELAAGATQLPWPTDDAWPIIAGELARIQGAQVPARLVASAKSWLCHPRVDRLAAILPWGTDAESTTSSEITKISPVAASARYLAHLAGAWEHAHGARLSEQEVVLGVPASFDEVARELTLRAAAEVGLQPTLLEEPQAAFYAWLADHPESELRDGDSVLVFDVGGGTTDFSLIRVEGDGAERRYVRTAVGDHLLLGGDNMDLAIARRVEGRLAKGGRLDNHSFSALVQACRTAKEQLLGEAPRASWTVSVAGRGSKLIGGSLRDELTQAEVETLVLDGFFPRVALDAAPQKNVRSAIQEFGLPYAADPAITRHAAQFLTAHNTRPTAILWNGGVLKSAAIKRRVLEVLTDWLGHTPRVLENRDPDLAVARGAAYFGLTRHGLGQRIGGGAARAYYLGIDTPHVRPGEVTALCVIPRGMEEGTAHDLKAHALELVTNRPVRFRLFSSSAAAQERDRAGDLYSGPADALTELPPLYTVLRFARAAPDTALAVYLNARLTDLGALELECVARATGNERDRWRLDFDLRASDESSKDLPVAAATDATPLDQAQIDRAIALLNATWSKEGTGDPQTIMKSLAAILGPRERWPVPLLRALWEPLHALRGGRGKSAAHEARWLNLVGYVLRPGFGYPLDDWRCKETWRLFNAGTVHDKDDPCRLEWWILWRRISGGLTKTQQDELWKRVAPYLLPSFAKKADRKPVGPQESAEMWRTLAAMERLTGKQKLELGDVLVTQLESRRSLEKKVLDLAPWALGRLGARVPLYGGVEDLVSAKKVERWLERLMALAGQAPDEVRGEALALAVAEMARASGDRARDLDEPLRQKIAHWLQQLGARSSAAEATATGQRLARLVLEPTAREEREQKLAFGDALPSGLRLAE